MTKEKVLKKYDNINKRTVKIITRAALLSYLTYVHSLIPQGYEAAMNIPEVNPHRIAAIPTFVLDPIFEELLNLSRFRVLLTFTGDADKFNAAVARFREDG
ncbi:hypothetical protein ACTXT7_008714 [Hymenolepis weldensis]